MLLTFLRRNALSWGSQSMSRIKTFAFLDLETTGLPFYESNRTKITELTMSTVLADHLNLGVVPRVQNKLTLCFNPQKLVSADSEKITNLSNETLQHLAPFTSATVEMINNFLKHSPKPVCLVAHYGNKFDFPILRTAILKTGVGLMEDIACIDSIETFRELHERSYAEASEEVPLEFQDGFDELLCKVMDDFDETQTKLQGSKRPLDVQKINETTPERKIKNENMGTLSKEIVSNAKKPRMLTSKKSIHFDTSFKLVDVFERLTKQKAIGAHQAENDVNMLMMCAATLGEQFTTWADRNKRKFSDIPEMKPGRVIGR
ncbi:three prime repair exonuclease 2 [Euwallacea similis]|uniref:three prime repair exonuclease 2 n=1 Tax=Euwallacea similis TaxID=1736056 RepID=UPI00344B91BA